MTTDRYRKRPVEIDAVQWTDNNAAELEAFAGPRFMTIDPEDRTDDPDATAAIRTSAHETWALLLPGDWVIKRGEDNFGLLPGDEFADLYEPAGQAPATDRECAASTSGSCLAEGQSETACDTDAGECVHGGKPATDRAALRDRIADVLAAADDETWGADSDKVRSPAYQGYQDRADAVLAVLPAPTDRAASDLRQPAYDAVFAYIRQQPRDSLPTTIVGRNAMIWRAVHAALDAVLPAAADRAAVLRELEARYRQHARDSVHPDFRAAYSAVANDLRRMADETPPQRTPCSVPECDFDGTGEPCTRHEREDDEAQQDGAQP
jgi:hypothetical protein